MEAIFVIIAALAALAIIGCSDAVRQDRGEVFGSVTLDDEPVPTGTIVFRPERHASGFDAAAEIVDGKYHIPVRSGPSVGKNVVQFLGARKTGAHVIVDDRLQDEWVNVFPPQFGKESTEMRTVVPGRNVFEFHLSTKEIPAASDEIR